MRKSVLQEIAEKLLDQYGSDRHFEITKAERYNGTWQLEVVEIEDTAKADESEGAGNESDQ